MGQNYEGIDMAELLGENERLASSGPSDFLENFVRMPDKDGHVTIRILPRGRGKKLFCATRTHRVNSRSVHCSKELINGKWLDPDPKNPCVICKYYSELWKNSEKKEGKEAEELQNQARAIKPVERYYYNCIVRQQMNPKTNEIEKNVGPKILSIGKTIHQRIVRAIVGDETLGEKPLGDVTDPTNGRDFKIIKRIRPGKDAFPNYDDSKFLDVSPLGDPEQVDKWLSTLHDLAALRIVKSHDDMKVELKKHLGLVKDDSTNFDISEFQKPAASLEEQIQKAETKVEATPAAPAAQDQVLADEDFLAELRNM